MKRWIVPILLVGALGAAAGGGWWVWRWMQTATAQRARVSAQLADAESSLKKTQEEFRALQDTHQALEHQHTETETELRRLNVTHTLLSDQVQALTKEKEVATGQLAQAMQESNQLKQDLGTVRERLDAFNRQRDQGAARLKELESQISRLNEAQATTGRERDQMKQQLDERRSQLEQLQEKISDVSSAYDRLLGAQLATPAGQKFLQQASGQHAEKPLSPSERRRQARLHQDLARAYWAMEQYAKAGEELEQSLRLVDDPQVHAEITVLYSRFLNDPERASRHLVKAKGARLLSVVPLSQPYQLPRSSTHLVQDYLHDQ